MAVRALLHHALEVLDLTVGEKLHTRFGLDRWGPPVPEDFGLDREVEG